MFTAINSLEMMSTKPKLKICVNSAIAISQYIMQQYQIYDPIKLQKLLFFLTLESLKQRDQLLFKEPFEAWIYGPVVPEVYRYFHFRAPSIPETGSLNFIKNLKDAKIKSFIDLNLPKYLKFTTLELRDWAHQTAPWIRAREGNKDWARSRNKIKESELRKFAHSLQFQWEEINSKKDYNDY